MTRGKHLRLSLLLSAVALMASSACSIMEDDGNKPPLEGERISILELQRDLEPDDAALEAQGFIAPDPWRNEFWPQAGGYPNHAMQHLSLNPNALQKLWSAKIGEGSRDGLPLTAQPIVVDGKVFTLDSDSVLSAFDITSGQKIWAVNIGHPAEDDPVIGGGVSYSRGQLYATNGYSEVIALNPNDGKTVWRRKTPAPSRAAPTVMDDRLFVATLDNRLLALNTADGRTLWEFAGVNETAGLVGAASPAASRDIVIPAFSSGELFALRVENGALAWSDNLSGLRGNSGLSGISDIRGLPVIDKGIVVAISFGNRIVAIDERTGNRIWQREIGGAETPWVAGNHLFVITSENNLVGMGRDTGLIRWVTALPKFKDADDRSGPIFWSGPVLAGGRLIAAGSHGMVAEFNPEDGALIREWPAGTSIETAPVVAGDVLYLLGEDGTLLAYK